MADPKKQERPEEIYARVLNRLLGVNVSYYNADVIARQVATGQVSEEDAYAYISASSGMDIVDAIDAGAQPDTAQVIADKIQPSRGKESSPQGPGISFMDAMGKASPFFGPARQGPDYDQPNIFMHGMRQEPLRSVKTGSNASAAQMFGEFTLGGLWQMVDTALLGIPGLVEHGLGKLGVYDEKGFFAWEGGEFILSPETTAGRIGSGIGAFAGFVAPWSRIAPTKILHKVGAKVIGTEAKIAKAGAKIAKTGKQAAEFAKVADVVGDVGKAEKIIKAGADVVAAAPTQMGLKKIPHVIRQHKALKDAARAIDMTEDYTKIIRKGISATSDVGIQYFDDTMKAAMGAAQEAALKQGVMLEGDVLKAVEQVIGKGMVRNVPITSAATKASSYFGAWARHVVEHSVQIGAGMAAYKALRYGVIEPMKAEGYSSYGEAIKDFNLPDAGKQLAAEALSGLAEGALLGAVTGGIPNVGYRKTGSSWKDMQTAMGVSESKLARGWRKWQKFVRVMSHGKRGFYAGEKWPYDPAFEMVETEDGQKRLFEIAKMMNKTAKHTAGSTYMDTLLNRHPVFEKGTWGGAEDAKAIAHAIVDSRRAIGAMLMRGATRDWAKNFAGAMPRMMFTAAALNAKTAFNADMWRDFPGDQLFGLISSAYIGYHGGYIADATQVGSTFDMDTVYSRQMLRMLGAYSPQANMRGPGGQVSGLVDAGIYMPYAVQKLWDYRSSPFSNRRDYTAHSVYKQDIEVINDVVKNTPRTRLLTQKEKELIDAGFNDNVRIIAQNYNNFAPDDPDKIPLNYHEWSEAETFAAGEAMVRNQDTGSSLPSTAFYGNKLTKIARNDDLQIVTHAHKYVKEAMRRMGYDPNRIPYIEPSRSRDPMHPKEEDYELDRLYKTYNDIVAGMAYEKSHKMDWHKGGIQRKVVDRELMLTALGEAEGVMVDSLNKSAEVGDVKRVDNLFSAEYAASVVRLGVSAVSDFAFKGARYTLREPRVIAGERKWDVDRQDIISMFKEAGLVKDDGSHANIKDLGLNVADEATLDAFLNLMDRHNLTWPSHEDKPGGMSDHEKSVARDIVSTLYDIGVTTTRDANSEVMYRYYQEEWDAKLTPRTMHVIDKLMDKGIIHRGEMFMINTYDIESYETAGGANVMGIKTEDAGLLDHPGMDMFAEDIQLAKDANIVTKIHKIFPAENKGAAAFWERESFANFIDTIYSEDVVQRRGEEFRNLIMKELVKNVNKKDLTETMRNRMGKVHLILASGGSAQLARAMRIFHETNAIGFDNQRRIEIKSEQLFSKASEKLLDEALLADSEIRGNSKRYAELVDTYYSDLDLIKRMTDPELDIRAKSISDFSKELGLTKRQFVDIATRVHTGDLGDPDALIEHMKRIGATIPESMQSDDKVAVFKEFYNREIVDEYSYHNGPIPSIVNEETGEQEVVSADVGVNGVSVLKNIYMDKIKSRFVDEQGQGARMHVVSQWGIHNGKKFNLFNKSHGERTYRFLERIVTGNIGRAYRSSVSERDATIVRAEKVDGGRPGLLMIDGSGDIQVVSLHAPGTGGVGEIKSAGYLFEYSRRITSNFGQLETTGNENIDRLIEKANWYTGEIKRAATEKNTQTLKDAYAELMRGHMLPGEPGEHVGLNSDANKIFEVGMLLDAYGPGYVQEYFDAVASRDRVKVSDWASRQHKRAKLVFGNHFNIGNSNMTPELSAKAARDLAKWKGKNRPQGTVHKVYKNKHTGKEEPHVRVMVVKGLKTPDGPAYVDLMTLELLRRTLGARERAGTIKPEIHMPGFGTDFSMVAKCELSLHDGYRDFMTSNQIHIMIPEASVPWIGKDVPVHDIGTGPDAEANFNRMATKSTRANIDQYVFEMPLSSIIHMSTPSDGAPGAMMSFSKGLGQNSPDVLRYWSRHVMTADMEVTRELDKAMGLAAKAESPQNMWDIIRANAYMQQLLRDTKGGGEFGLEEDASYSQYEQSLKADYRVNPFDSVHRDRSMNLIRKRIIEPALMRAKNPHGTTSIIQYDAYHGTEHALGEDEVLAPYEMQNRRLHDDTSIAIQRADGGYEVKMTDLEGLTYFVERVMETNPSAKAAFGKATAEQIAGDMQRAIIGTPDKLNFRTKFDPSTAGRLHEAMDWITSGKKSSDPTWKQGKFDNRTFKYGLTGPAWRIPTETADDTFLAVVTGFNSAEMGNQIIAHAKKIEKVHGDGDGDKLNFTFDASPKVIAELKHVQDYKNLGVTDEGVTRADNQEAEYSPKKPGAEGAAYDFFNPRNKIKYRQHADHAQKQLGRVISLMQAVNEMILRGMKVKQMDRNGNLYILRPRLRYSEEGGDTRLNYQNYADSPFASEIARIMQMFVSQPGKYLPEQMMDDTWHDDLMTKLFMRDYEVPGAKIEQRYEQRDYIQSSDIDLLTRILGNYKSLAGILSPEYVDGSARTRNWGSITNSVNKYVSSRGHGKLDQNRLMAGVLRTLIGDNSPSAWDMERSILGAMGWDVDVDPTKGPAEPRKGRLFRDLAGKLSNLVTFRRPGNASKSVMERLGDRLYKLNANYEKERGRSLDYGDAEWMEVLNDFYHGEGNPYLTSTSLEAMTDVFKTFKTGGATSSLKGLRKQLNAVNAEMRWNENPRDVSSLLNQKRYYQSRIQAIEDAIPKLKKVDRNTPKTYDLRKGGAAHPSIQIHSDREAYAAMAEGLSWRMVAAEYADDANPELLESLTSVREIYHKARRSMRKAGMNPRSTVIKVPRNILDPNSALMDIEANGGSMEQVEHNWMRQINHAYVEAGPLVPLMLATPSENGLLGSYTMNNGNVIPIYKTPYTRALSFYQKMYPTGAKEISEAFALVGAYQAGINKGLVTPDALRALRTARGLVSPLQGDFWGRAGKPFPGKYLTQDFLNTPAGIDDFQGYPRILGNGTADIDSSRNIRYYTYQGEEEASRAADMVANVVNITQGQKIPGKPTKLTNRLIGSMTIRKLMKIVDAARFPVTKVINADGAPVEAHKEAFHALNKQAMKDAILSLAQRSGEISLGELPAPIAETVERYFVRVYGKLLPKPGPDVIKQWASGMRSVDPNFDLKGMIASIEGGYNDIAQIKEESGDLDGAQALRYQGKNVSGRLDVLFRKIKSDKLLQTAWLNNFPIRQWVIETTGLDPYGAGERVQLLDESAVRELELDYMRQSEGLKKLRGGKEALIKRGIYSPRAFLDRSKPGRDMHRRATMENQEFMARTERIQGRVQRIKDMVYKATGEKWLAAAFRKRGLRRGALETLNAIDNKMQAMRNVILEAPRSQRPGLEMKLTALGKKRDKIMDTAQYTAQDVLIKLVEGIKSFKGGAPNEFVAGEKGEEAKRLVTAYGELVPAAYEARILTNEVHGWLRETAKVLTNTKIAELEARLSDGGKVPLSQREERLLQSLKEHGMEIGKIEAYFPYIRPTAITKLNTIYNKLDNISVGSGTATAGLESLEQDVRMFVNEHILHRTDYAPEFIHNFVGSLSTYGTNVAAFRYRVAIEQTIRETVNWFHRAMANNEFNKEFGDGTRDMITYLDKLQQDCIGKQPDDLTSTALNTMRAFSTISKIAWSPITVLRQGSQKLLNIFVLGPKALKEARALLSSTEHTALTNAALDYVPVGFADTSSQHTEQILRQLHGNTETFASKVQNAVSWAVQKGLHWLKEAPMIGESAMRREAFSAMFIKSYNSLAKSNALKHTFRNRSFSEHFMDYYPDSRGFKNVEGWENENGGGKWVTEFERYITTQAKTKAYELVRAIHFDYSKISKPEILRNPALAALWHLRSYDIFHTELFVDAFKQLQYRAKASLGAGRALGKGTGWAIEDITKSPEFSMMGRLSMAYGLIGLISAVFPVGLYSYLRPGSLDLVANFTDWMTGLQDPDKQKRRAKFEKMFFGKGALTQLTGPILSDLIDVINIVGADQIGEPNAFNKYVIGLRDYRTLPSDVKLHKWTSKLSAPFARLLRDGGTLMNAAAAGQFQDEWPATMMKHFGMSGAGTEPYEQWASKSVASFLTNKLAFMPGIEPPKKPTPPGGTKIVKTERIMPKWLKGT